MISFEKLKKLCKDVGTDWVELKVFDGTHEFCRDDEPIRRLVNDIKSHSPYSNIIVQACPPVAENMDVSAYSVN